VVICISDMEDVLNTLAKEQDKYGCPTISFFTKQRKISCSIISIGTKQCDCTIEPKGTEFQLYMKLSQESVGKSFTSIIDAINYFLHFYDLKIDHKPLRYVKVNG
jgi:hypothetical protein